MSISATTSRGAVRALRAALSGRAPRGRALAVAALAFALLSLGCAPSGESKGLSGPPGLVAGARVADIRMFEFDQQSRITLVDGDVVTIAWPWVLVGSRGAGGARFWVNFNHVCSFRLEK